MLCLSIPVACDVSLVDTHHSLASYPAAFLHMARRPCNTLHLLQNNPPAELVPVQELYNHRAIQLSLLVACMYTAVGVFNLGFLTNFLSHSVIGGFTSGAAISE